MGSTNDSGIWTPDEDDVMDPDVWSKQMGESIHQGLGKRMLLQEERISLRATTPIPFDVDSPTPDTAYMQVPLTIASNTGIRAPEPDYSGGNHADGILLEGDYAKIVTPGLYTISGRVTLIPKGDPHSWDFYGSASGTLLGLPDYGVTSLLSYVGGAFSDTRFLAEGDMISLTVGVGTDHIGSLRVQDALLTVALLYALPVV